jgi:hypothetical protein
MAIQMHDVLDDDQLLGALGAAMGARRTVPVKFVQTARNAYAWHDIDADLARLSHDRDPDFLPRVTPPPESPGTAPWPARSGRRLGPA